jgi:F0F1-type ATP synthase assembly protein I
MATPKKIFFSYSNQPEDLELYKKINKHFKAYADIGLLGIIDRKELFKLTGDKNAVVDILRTSDMAILLLSIDYITDEECIQQLKAASDNEVRIVPVLLRDFDWEAFNNITRYRQQLLPGDHRPVENYITEGGNDDTIFKEIAQKVKAIILPEIGKLEVQKTSNKFYYIIAGIVFIAGIVVSAIVYSLTDRFVQTQRILFTALSLLMFACIGLIALKNVLFPNKLNIKN